MVYFELSENLERILLKILMGEKCLAVFKLILCAVDHNLRAAALRLN